MRRVTTHARTTILSVEGGENSEAWACDNLAMRCEPHMRVEYNDEASGEKLDIAEVERARREDIEYFKEMEVYKKVPYSRAVETTWKKPIGVKWVDVLKTSGKHSSSRLVAKELNNGDDPEMYASSSARRRSAPTPPLEGVKILLTMAAGGEHARRASGSRKPQRSEDSVLMHVDVHRAYLNALVERGIFTEILPEDTTAGEPKQCGKRIQAMYGVCHAAVACQTDAQKAMHGSGMEAGACSPCACRHRGWRSSHRPWRRLLDVRAPGVVGSIKKALGQLWQIERRQGTPRRRREGVAHSQLEGSLERQRH